MTLTTVVAGTVNIEVSTAEQGADNQRTCIFCSKIERLKMQSGPRRGAKRRVYRGTGNYSVDHGKDGTLVSVLREGQPRLQCYAASNTGSWRDVCRSAEHFWSSRRGENRYGRSHGMDGEGCGDWWSEGGRRKQHFWGARSSQDGQFLHTIWQKRASDGDQTKACLECSGSRRARMTASG